MTPEENRNPAPANDWSPPREPIFNTPLVVLVFIALMAVIHVARVYLLTTAQDDMLLDRVSFVPARYVHSLAEQGLLGYFAGPFTYSLIHASWLHLASNSLVLVIFATSVAQRLGALRFTLLWFSSAAAGAFFLAVLTGFEPSLLLGASGVVSAFAGAACRFYVPWMNTKHRRAAIQGPRLGVIDALNAQSVIAIILILVLSSVPGITTGPEAGNIAWQSHLGGFLFGYLAFALFDPPLRR